VQNFGSDENLSAGDLTPASVPSMTITKLAALLQNSAFQDASKSKI